MTPGETASTAPTLGITGSIGAGKSTVSRRLGEHGADVIDADKLGHEMLTRPDVMNELIHRFGHGILNESGQISRRALGAIVFADKRELERLEQVVHPLMEAEFERRQRDAVASGVPVVIDAALLFEAGWNARCDAVVVVDAPPDVRLDRLQATRGWSEEDFHRREKAQWPIERKREEADWIIENAGSIEECSAKADAMFEDWKARLRDGPVPAEDLLESE
jgi:dephospho-CoA kinase